MKIASETTTENIFRNFYGSCTFIEKSVIPKEYGFKSKKKNDNYGYPDFFLDDNDFSIVVEAKAKNHRKAQSEIKYYINNNNIEKDIVGIAISGQDELSLKITYYLRIYDTNTCIELLTDTKLFSIENIKKLYYKSKQNEIISEDHLTKILYSLNKQFHDEDIVRDTERSLFFSGLMIALKDPSFRNTYMAIHPPTILHKKSDSKLLEAQILNEEIIKAITRQLDGKINNLSKKYNWEDRFSFIKTIDYSLIKYKSMIRLIEKNIFIPFENEEKQDILGKAYKIFLKKAGKIDNKNIILTPDHIKSLMVKLARLNVSDVVLDTCTGSGGFLMEAMETMIMMADGDENTIRNIQEKQLIGFENDPVLFALACSNMFLHGDGRTNLIYRSSLLNDEHEHIVNANNSIRNNDRELFEEIRKISPKKVIINPPYENNKPIKFTKQALDYLEQDGKLIIIMPTPTLVHNQGGITDDILAIARLDFVIKMPENLFSEQGRTVNTSIFGFTKTPHNIDDIVMFYNLRDDGYVSIQNKGRICKDDDWNIREKEVIDNINYFNEVENVCEKRKIYNENGKLNCAGFRKPKSSLYELVKIGDMFNKTKGALASESNDSNGIYDFVTAASDFKKHTEFTHDCEAIIFAVSASGSLGRTHYVNGKFIASNLCLILTPKNNEYKINLKFYNYYFEKIREQIRDDLADGTSKLVIKPEDLMNYYIEYIPYDIQCDFCNLHIKRYEELKNNLLETKQKLYKNMDNLINKV